MHEALALIRASWLSATSYRIRTILSLGAMLGTVVPVYFVAGALQPVVAESIRTEGSDYFAFLLVGIIATRFLQTSLHALPAAVGAGVGSGILEALLSTPVRLPALLSGLTGYSFLWTAAQAALMTLVGVGLGVDFAWNRLLAGLGILVLIVLAHLPFGILSAAAVLAFRTPTPLSRGVLLLSTLLGGVYYSASVIPSWLNGVAHLIPLTYGLRALRRTILEGYPLGAVAEDVLLLGVFAVVLLGVSLWSLDRAMRYARTAGTLSHY